jgi:hypothetical protein
VDSPSETVISLSCSRFSSRTISRSSSMFTQHPPQGGGL